MDIYALYRNFWDWAFENPEKIKPNHIAIYSFAIEHCNRLGWKKKFGFPSAMAMDAIGVKSYGTYIKSLNELVDWGFIKMIEKSRNQYSANIIALSENNKAHTKALDKAFLKHASKQPESTHQSIDSIDKQVYKDTSIQIENYPKELFFEDWNELRKEHLKKPSFIKSMSSYDLAEFKELKEAYTRDEFRIALIGLFRQKKMPNDITSMQTNPTHFLKFFNSYITAGNDKDSSIYGKTSQE